MPHIEETLNRLAIAFAVKDIMTPRTGLVCALNGMQAARVSDDNPDYDVIPIQQGGILTGYFERKLRRARKITPADLIADGTSLLDLVEILEERQFSFVLSRQKIEGYVHYSDLNHQLVKLTFYVMLEALERTALNSIHSTSDRESLKKDLPEQRFEQIEKAYKRAGRAARDLLGYLNLSDMLQLAAKRGHVSVEGRFIKAMKKVRDGAAHSTENLVSSYDDVKTLANVKRECLRVLGTS
ncbi:MAG: hypothetical protein ACRD4X_12535 [Candidatus Acidiferrales bacterium]